MVVRAIVASKIELIDGRMDASVLALSTERGERARVRMCHGTDTYGIDKKNVIRFSLLLKRVGFWFWPKPIFHT